MLIKASPDTLVRRKLDLELLESEPEPKSPSTPATSAGDGERGDGKCKASEC